MKKLYFIRHGQSVLNAEKKLAGRTETPLTDEGRARAKREGQIAKAKHLRIDLIVSSPLGRALETAQIFAREIGYPVDEIIVSELITERDFGEGEGTPWTPDPNGKRHFEGMEYDKELLVRARKALDWIENQEANNVLIVSHGATGRALRSLIHEDFPMSHPHRLGNAELYEWL